MFTVMVVDRAVLNNMHNHKESISTKNHIHKESISYTILCCCLMMFTVMVVNRAVLNNMHDHKESISTKNQYPHAHLKRRKAVLTQFG